MAKFNLFFSLLISIIISQSVQANVSWSFSTANCTSSDCSGLSNSSNGNSQSFGSGLDSVTVTSFSTTDDGPTATDPHKFETAHLGLYTGGLGIQSQDESSGSPNHAMDNNGGDWGDDVDAALFSFNEEVSLNGVEIGWKSGDSDISVFAHNGIGDSSLVGKTFAQLLDNGWSLISHYSNLFVGVTEDISNPTFASDWIITAYTPEIQSEGWTTGNDYFKLSGLTGVTQGTDPGPSVPEPYSLFLLLFSFLSWKAYYRNWNRADVRIMKIAV